MESQKINVKCNYCSNEYRKTSLKQHLLRCKMKIEQEKNEIIKKTCSQKFIEDETQNIDSSMKNYFHYIPNEIIFIIVSYLFSDPKDDFCSYRRLYKEYLNICFLSKRLYNILYPSFESILTYKKNLKEERENKICKSTAKSVYKLTDSELEYEISYYLVNNPHYRSSFPMKIYQIADILDYMYSKYESKYNYDHALLLKEQKKEISKKKTAETKKKRIIHFTELMNTYHFNENDDIYHDFYSDYVNKGIFSLKKIESELKAYIAKEERKEKIVHELKNDYQKIRSYIHHPIVKDHIENGNHTWKETIERIMDIENRKYELTELFSKINLDFDREYHIYNQKNRIHNYIENNIGNASEIVECIGNKNTRKNNLLEEFHKNGFHMEVEKKKQNESLMIYDFIENGKNSIENIIHYMIGKRDREINIKIELKENIYRKEIEKLNIYKDYIEYGDSENYHKIHETLKEFVLNHFYKNFTNYKQEFMNIRNLYKDYSYEIIYKLAQKQALLLWCNKYNTYEEAIHNINLPSYLYEDIYNIYEDPLQMEKKDISTIDKTKNDHLLKCTCNNAASIICLHCKKCCSIMFCIKHSYFFNKLK